MPTFSSTLPSINTFDELSRFLQLSEIGLKRLCLRSKNFYHTFEHKKKSGRGVRTICAPAPELKAIQRRLKAELLDKVELHSACTGYRKGMSIVSNAQGHVGQRFVFNMDLQDFFQSISTGRVAGLFMSFGYAEDVALLLAKLCCFKNALPQGAPSSPAIANLVCHKLDRRISGLARSQNMRYTRYCDDITISSNKRISDSTIELLKSILKEEGFSINEDKTRLLTRRSCQIVTGLSVNEKVNIPRRKRRVIRAVFHQAKQRIVGDDNYSNYLHGLASYIRMVKKRSLSSSIGIAQP